MVNRTTGRLQVMPEYLSGPKAMTVEFPVEFGESFVRSKLLTKTLCSVVAASMLLAPAAFAQNAPARAATGSPEPTHQGAAFNQHPNGVTTRTNCRDDVWIDPNKTEPSGTRYALYDTPSRGPHTQGSYLIYLPPDYQTAKNRRYPVLYWLHGGGQDQHSGGPVVERIDAEVRAGKIAPFIVVLPEAVPDVRYINSKDGKIPLEDVMIKDLIPHIDATYRTIPQRVARGIEGFSMGGFGSLRLGFKFPDLFGAVSALAPSITNYKDEPACIVAAFGDQEYYDRVGPWEILKAHADVIRGRTDVRLLVGDKDMLLPLVKKYDALLTELNIQHQFAISAPNVDHRVELILDRAPYDPFGFWKGYFEKLNIKR